MPSGRESGFRSHHYGSPGSVVPACSRDRPPTTGSRCEITPRASVFTVSSMTHLLPQPWCVPGIRCLLSPSKGSVVNVGRKKKIQPTTWGHRNTGGPTGLPSSCSWSPESGHEFPFQLRAVGSESLCPQHSRASVQTGALGLVTSKPCPAYQVPPTLRPPPGNCVVAPGRRWARSGRTRGPRRAPHPPSSCSPEARDRAHRPHCQVCAPESQGLVLTISGHTTARGTLSSCSLLPTHFRPSTCTPAAPAPARTGAQKDATPASGTCGFRALLAWEQR